MPENPRAPRRAARATRGRIRRTEPGPVDIDGAGLGRSAPPAPRAARRPAILERNAAGAEPRPAAPVLVAAPALAGAGEIGAALTASPGRWSGDPAPQVAFQWRRDGTDIPGAAARAYVPGPEDDRRALDCAVTAWNAAGAATAIAGPLRATYPAPRTSGDLPEEVFDAGAGPQPVETADVFEGADLTFSVAGVAGAAIDPRSGVLALPTERPLSGACVTVAATNSGGAAWALLRFTVEAASAEEAPPPEAPRAPGGPVGGLVGPTSAMLQAAMLNGGRLRGFNDYDFLKYSQKDNPYQSTCIRDKKRAHLATIVALAAWAGHRGVFGGRTAAERAAEQLTAWATDQGPAARGGVGMQCDLMFANCAALGRATPAVWDAIAAGDRTRIDVAMEGLLVSAAWQNSDNNPFVKAGRRSAERTITGGDYARSRVPNFTSASVLMPHVVVAYMGLAEAQAFLAGFERAAFAAAVAAANANGALADLAATFERDWTGGPNGPGPTAAALEAAVRRGPDGGPYRQFGRSLAEPTASMTRETGKMWGATIRPGIDPARVRRVPPGVEKRMGEVGVFEQAENPGTPNAAPGRDAQVARLLDMAAYAGHAYAGLDGMATELDTTDGGANGSGGGPRASMSYAVEGCSVLLTAGAVLAALDRLDRGDPALAAGLARQGRGVYDLRFRSIHGHRSFAKGGRLWAGDGTNSDWDEAEAASLQMFELFDVWDLQLALWAPG